MHVFSLHCLFFFLCNIWRQRRLLLWFSSHKRTLWAAIWILHCAADVWFLCHLETTVTYSSGVWLCISEQEQWMRLGSSAVYCQEACHGSDPLSAPFLIIMHFWDWPYKLHLNLCQSKSISFLRMTLLPAHGTGLSVRQAEDKGCVFGPSWWWLFKPN